MPAGAHRKAAGFMVASPEEARAKLDQGFRCLAYWGDLWIYQQALSAAMQRIRSEAAISRPRHRPRRSATPRR